MTEFHQQMQNNGFWDNFEALKEPEILWREMWRMW